MAADNKFNAAFEPNAAEARERRAFNPKQVMPYAHFIDMIRPAFCKEASNTDLDAIAKRCTVIVHCKEFVYVKAAGTEDKCDIMRFPMKSELLIKKETKTLLEKWSEERRNEGGPKRARTPIRNTDEMASLAAAEMEWFNKQLSEAPEEAPAAMDAAHDTAAPVAEPPAVRLISAFTDEITSLPPDFGIMPPALADGRAIDVDQARAAFAEFKRDCRWCFDGKVSSMKDQLEKAMGLVEEFVIPRWSVSL